MESTYMTVLVKHYLTEEGLHYFENVWMPRVVFILEKQPGYISIEYQRNKDEPDCVDIDLIFSNSVTFDAWCSIAEHDELLHALDPYRSRPYFDAAKIDDDPANPTWIRYSAES